MHASRGAGFPRPAPAPVVLQEEKRMVFEDKVQLPRLYMTWPSVKMKDSATLTLKKGSTLKSRFPKGVPVTLRVVNPDGGQASMSYTR